MLKRGMVVHLVLLLSLMAASWAEAAIGLAVAKDRNGSTGAYMLRWDCGESFNVEQHAKKLLKNKGHKTVYTLTGGKGRGHDLNSGVYVLVICERKDSQGRPYKSLGMGAHPSSHQEAERRAVSNLKQYDWGWKRKKHGYRVFKSGAFSSNCANNNTSSGSSGRTHGPGQGSGSPGAPPGLDPPPDMNALMQRTNQLLMQASQGQVDQQGLCQALGQVWSQLARLVSSDPNPQGLNMLAGLRPMYDQALGDCKSSTKAIESRLGIRLP
jgi:hypothetical protein